MSHQKTPKGPAAVFLELLKCLKQQHVHMFTKFKHFLKSATCVEEEVFVADFACLYNMFLNIQAIAEASPSLLSQHCKGLFRFSPLEPASL